MTGSGFFIQKEAWMLLAKCKDSDPDLFILKKGQSAEAGKAICRECPVREPCLEYAIKTRSVGVWGGRVLAWRDEPVELYPVRPLQDATSKRLPIIQSGPSILGKVFSPYTTVPSIMGINRERIESDGT